ncbi:MAG: replicative DNA helicase [Erysipelothrix sp.]|nr:replicative DNA helicase [Erysipelothrix sp.]
MARTLPSSVDAEQAILGAMLMYPNAVQAAVEYGLLAEHFFLLSHQQLAQTMFDIFEENSPVDPTILKTRLEDLNILNSVGGLDYILALTDSATTSATLKHYVEIIINKHTLRRLMEAMGTLSDEAATNPSDIEGIMDSAERAIYNITRSRRSEDFRTSKEVVEAVLESIKLKSESGTNITGMKTGYGDLDNITSGFQRGDLIILAARPSVGKTAFALNVGVNMALYNDLPTAIFSLEMPAEQLMSRILTFESEIKGTKLRDGTLRSDTEWNKLYEAANRVKEAKIFIDDSPSLRISDIFSKCRKLKAEHDLGVIIIDYLQLMESNKNAESRQQAVSEISRAFKGLARELDVPVIALSQLSRSVETRADKRPMLSDLRESGAIEQDADIVMFLYREDYHSLEEEADRQDTDVIIAKHRNGSLADVKLVFDKTINKFFSRVNHPGVNF